MGRCSHIGPFLLRAVTALRSQAGRRYRSSRRFHCSYEWKRTDGSMDII
jgi:hypothetical protein